MIVILSDTRFDGHSGEIKSALEAKFAGLPTQIVDSSRPCSWTQAETWSDALVVPYDGRPLLSDGLKFVEAALRRSPPPFILPVATIAGTRVPPAPLDGIKALPFESAGFARGCARVGARLGLALRSRDHTIFISYRAVDGTGLAAQFENYLKSEGYNVWRMTLATISTAKRRFVQVSRFSNKLKRICPERTWFCSSTRLGHRNPSGSTSRSA